MIVLPAIDILDGKPVRLYQGDYGQSKCVAEDVLACAKKFEKEKANYLHVVDLNGAKEGSRVNADLICEVVKTCQLPVEVGGGIRTMEAIDFYIENGVLKSEQAQKIHENRRIYTKEQIEKDIRNFFNNIKIKG